MHFRNMEEFCRRLDASPLVFETEPETLTRRDVFRQAMAGGNFNPAHNYPPDGKVRSIFKSIVGHGLGTIARAEGCFVERFLPMIETPIEIIGDGHDDLRYKGPIKVGETYRFRYEMSKHELRKGWWHIPTHMVCEKLEAGAKPRIVVETTSRLIFIELEATPDNLNALRRQHVRREDFVEIYLRKSTVRAASAFFALACATLGLALIPVPTVAAQSVLPETYEVRMDTLLRMVQ